MSDLIDRNLIAELVDSHGNVHWEDIAGLPSEQPDVRTQMSSADCISRQAAIDALAKEIPSLTTPDGRGEFDHEIQITAEAFVDCMQIINGLPSAQPTCNALEQVVQCRDCKYWEGEYRKGFWYFEQCSLHRCTASDNDYCSWAERREE